MGDVTNYGIGKQIAKHNIDKNALIIELEDISKNSYKLLQKQYDRNPGSSKNYFNRNDVLYGKLRPYLKKCIVADCDGYCSTEIIPIKGYGAINPRFIMYDMTSPFMDNTINNLTYGMDMPRLGTKDAINLIMPLPPLTEQHRIVEAIEIALAKIDKLKVDETKLYNIQKVFPNKLRASLLQSAIQGKLTQQLPEDGDARDLLKQIEIEKARLINDKVIKKEKPLPEITEDEIPFDIPDNWVWVRLGDLLSVSSGKNLTKNDMVENGQYPVYGGNGINGFYNHYLVEQNTLVIGRVGFYCGSTHKVTSKSWVTDNALIVSFFSSSLNLDFFLHILNFLNLKQTSVATAQPVIAGNRLYNILCPLPTIAEQHRIVEALEIAVAKIDKLNKLTE